MIILEVGSSRMGERERAGIAAMATQTMEWMPSSSLAANNGQVKRKVGRNSNELSSLVMSIYFE